MIDITDESYESDLSEEESNKLLLLCGHAVGPQLSSAAQAVWNAADGACMYRPDRDDTRLAAAAALCAAVDLVVPEEPLYGGDQRWMYERDARQTCRRKLLAIAAELEALPDE